MPFLIPKAIDPILVLGGVAILVIGLVFGLALGVSVPHSTPSVAAPPIPGQTKDCCKRCKGCQVGNTGSLGATL